MVLRTRNLLIIGALAFFLLAACSLTGMFSDGDDDTVDAAPTLIASSTPNLTLTAVFARATDSAGEAPAATSETGTEEVPTATLAPEITETPTQTVVIVPDYAATPASVVEDGLAAYFLAEAPTIDGDLSDWGGEMLALDTVVYGNEYYANKDDLSGQFKISWDSNFLYLGVVVFDSRFAQTASGAQLYLGDSLEILIDTDLAGDANLTELSSDDFQIGISPGNLHDIAISEAYIWYPTERIASLQDVEIGAVLFDGGYVVEAALPWADISVTPSDAMVLGFLLSISDNDMLNMNAQQTVVSFVENRELQNPTTWSQLRLINQ